MARAFLKALAVWARRHHDHPTTIVIPVGTVDSAELAHVVRAIGLINRRSP